MQPLIDAVAKWPAAEEDFPRVRRLLTDQPLAQGEDVVAIPGTKRRRYLKENVGASDVALTDKDLAVIDEVSPYGVAAGGRYDERGLRTVDV